MLGTFIKSPGVQAIEILGDVGFDFVVIDSEHAPWDRSAIDLAVMAARASGIDAVVRVESITAIATALDCGATGVMVPHVFSAAVAQEVVDACRYRTGHRGFSNSPRAGGYGRLGLAAHVDASDERTTIIAMLEDPKALDQIEAIVAVDGIDAYFLGRGDLTVALGEVSSEAAAVRSVIAHFVGAVKAAKKPLCAFVNSSNEIAALRELGICTFIISSEQGLLRLAATAELTKFNKPAI
ncbi:aldolase/citrate lyase family protein [Polaromonas sp. P1(28)-13]|nr:aldolase/citrate lyase family protein [Polaromonas sp. P1(28)-13]